ncbi:3'(2'),5'-bisphosphate nucleotidase CysQ [Polynucleobacter paneuropaeus]|nr:3'(2'),5'-bisphosphate nucleotidase CysQ [Polynucleobacter paneuropaeus]
MNINELTDPLLEGVIHIAKEAGGLIMEIYQDQQGFAIKADGSPVTLADGLANDCIIEALALLSSGVPIISEESSPLEAKFISSEPFWLVDPLDGTKEFINRNGEFTVNIALIKDGRPYLGVVFAPALQTLYAGIVSEGAFMIDGAGIRKAIRCKHVPELAEILISRSHTSAELNHSHYQQFSKQFSLKPCGSSLKFCLIASGHADIYPRLGRTMEWDTAAAHAILCAAGGNVKTLAGGPLLYGKGGFENPHFVARGLDPFHLI